MTGRPPRSAKCSGGMERGPGGAVSAWMVPTSIQRPVSELELPPLERSSIPTPQSPTRQNHLSNRASQCSLEPCHFSEDQFSTNIDYLARQNSRIAVRFFLANDEQTVTFPGNGLNAPGNIPGFPSPAILASECSLLPIFNSNWLNASANWVCPHEGQRGGQDSVQLVRRWCGRRRK